MLDQLREFSRRDRAEMAYSREQRAPLINSVLPQHTLRCQGFSQVAIELGLHSPSTGRNSSCAHGCSALKTSSGNAQLLPSRVINCVIALAYQRCEFIGIEHFIHQATNSFNIIAGQRLL
jgi:hypothetical protein